MHACAVAIDSLHLVETKGVIEAYVREGSVSERPGLSFFSDAEERKKLTSCLELLLSNQQRTTPSGSDTHALAQRPQFWVVFLFLPDIQERFAVLKL